MAQVAQFLKETKNLNSTSKTWLLLVTIFTTILMLSWDPISTFQHTPLQNSSLQNILIISLLGILIFILFLFIYIILTFLLIKVGWLNKEHTNELSKNTSYLGRLDHLRFLAAILVVMYHYFHTYIGLDFISHNPLATLINKGHTGVGLFMVLSGFIFAVIGYKKQIKYFGFIFNRITRIYPLYLFAIIIASSTSAYTNVDQLFFFLPFLNESNLLNKFPYFSQLWTIAVEFQFYLLFPFINSFINRYGIKYILSFLFFSIFLKEFYFIQAGEIRDVAHLTILGRIDQFLIGILFAHLYKTKPKIFSNPIHLLISASLVLITLQWFNNIGGYYGTQKSNLWVFWSLIEGLFWAYLTISYVNLSVKIPEWFDNVVARLGACSFSIYIMHNIINNLVEKKIGLFHIFQSQVMNVVVTGLLIVTPCVVAMSLFTYHLIEKPFFSYRMKYAFDKEN